MLEVHQTVGQLEQLLRELHVHSVPVWNPAAKRACAPTLSFVLFAFLMLCADAMSRRLGGCRRHGRSGHVGVGQVSKAAVGCVDYVSSGER